MERKGGGRKEGGGGGGENGEGRGSENGEGGGSENREGGGKKRGESKRVQGVKVFLLKEIDYSVFILMIANSMIVTVSSF